MKNPFKKSAKEESKDFFSLSLYQKIGIILLVWVITGVIGWFWEFLIAQMREGWGGLYITGGNILPWINLYAYGALLFLFTTYRLRKRPLVVFLVSGLLAGILELFSGWIVYEIGNGTRYWDYTDQWFSFGHINGFVCPASAFAFGLGALLFIYKLMPWCIHLATTMTKKKFLTLSITLFSIFIIDDVTCLILEHSGLPSAHDFYRSLNWIDLSK